jgi:hypothetical protein
MPRLVPARADINIPSRPEDAASRGQGEREDGGREGSDSGIIPEQTGRLHQFH